MGQMVASGGILLQYNLSMSIGMTPFKALYGYEPLSFMDMVLGDNHTPRAKDWLQEGQDI